ALQVILRGAGGFFWRRCGAVAALGLRGVGRPPARPTPLRQPRRCAPSVSLARRRGAPTRPLPRIDSQCLQLAASLGRVSCLGFVGPVLVKRKILQGRDLSAPTGAPTDRIRAWFALRVGSQRL